MNVRDCEPPVPPREPEPGECCGSGCDPCVFDRYAADMDRYRIALAAWEDLRMPAAPPEST